MLEILKAVLFGVVEGITEWLPISSTGHMILLNEFVKLNVSSQFWDMFLVVIQFGAILAVILENDLAAWNLQTPQKNSHCMEKRHAEPVGEDNCGLHSCRSCGRSSG